MRKKHADYARDCIGPVLDSARSIRGPLSRLPRNGIRPTQSFGVLLSFYRQVWYQKYSAVYRPGNVHTQHAGSREQSAIYGVGKQDLGFDCLLLPNLYDTETFINPIPPRKLGGTLRIGSFGAGRPWKNQLVAAESAVQLARSLGVKLELWVNSKRPDGGERMIESRMELFDDLPGCKLIDVPWARWPRFRDITATMHLLFQPSFDETFNVVTADGIAEGVPSVTDSSIEWTPKSWWCQPEDPSSLVNVAQHLLSDHNAVYPARVQLQQYVNLGIGRWLDYLLHRTQL